MIFLEIPFLAWKDSGELHKCLGRGHQPAAGLIPNAVLPRWWGVTRNELHAITLYQRAGEELIAGATSNEELRGHVMTILSARMVPQRSLWLEHALREGHAEEVLPEMMPA